MWRRLEDEVVPAILRIETLDPGAVIEIEGTWGRRANNGTPVSDGKDGIGGEMLTEQESLVTSRQRPFASVPCETTLGEVRA